MVRLVCNGETAFFLTDHQPHQISVFICVFFSDTRAALNSSCSPSPCQTWVGCCVQTRPSQVSGPWEQEETTGTSSITLTLVFCLPLLAGHKETLSVPQRWVMAFLSHFPWRSRHGIFSLQINKPVTLHNTLCYPVPLTELRKIEFKISPSPLNLIMWKVTVTNVIYSGHAYKCEQNNYSHSFRWLWTRFSALFCRQRTREPFLIRVSQSDRRRFEGGRQKGSADSWEQLEQPYLAIVAWKCDWWPTQSAAQGDDWLQMPPT